MAKRIKVNKDDYVDLLREIAKEFWAEDITLEPWVPEKRNAKEGEEHLVGKMELNKARFYINLKKGLEQPISVGHYRIREADFVPGYKLDKKLTDAEFDRLSDYVTVLARNMRLKFGTGVPMMSDLETMAELAQEPHIEETSLVVHENGRYREIGTVRLEELPDGTVRGIFVIDEMTWDEVDVKHLIWRPRD